MFIWSEHTIPILHIFVSKVLCLVICCPWCSSQIISMTYHEDMCDGWSSHSGEMKTRGRFKEQGVRAGGNHVSV